MKLYHDPITRKAPMADGVPMSPFVPDGWADGDIMLRGKFKVGKSSVYATVRVPMSEFANPQDETCPVAVWSSKQNKWYFADTPPAGMFNARR